MAQLMFRIATEPHTDILSVKPDVPPCLADIINKALAKSVESSGISSNIPTLPQMQIANSFMKGCTNFQNDKKLAARSLLVAR